MAGGHEIDTLIEESSGNVFADLDLPNPEELLTKAKLASAIQDAIEERRLTRREAANLIGVEEATISEIFRGRLSDFTTELLLSFLLRLGLDIEVIVDREPHQRAGAIRVAYR